MRLSSLVLTALLSGSCLAQQGPAPAPAAPAPGLPAAAAGVPGADTEPHPLARGVPAGPVVYNVELIVFRTTATLGGPENWSMEAALAPAVPAATDEAGETGAPAAAAAAPSGRFVRQLAAADFQLDDVERRLRTSGIYVPVAHVAWAQSASPWGTHESMSVQQLGMDVPGLSGTVTLERGEFLHLGLALQLQIADPPAGLQAAAQTTFVLSDSHRVRFYESNYYDAPAFGVIALVTPAQGSRRAGR